MLFFAMPRKAEASRLKPLLRARRNAFASAARKAALWLFQVPSWPRRARVEKARRVGAMDRAEFAVSAGMRCRQTPERARAVARAGCARDRGREGRSRPLAAEGEAWMPTVRHATDGCLRKRVDSDLDKQEKETGPQGCGTNPHGCESVFAKAEKPEQKLDSSLRWNDEHKEQHHPHPTLSLKGMATKRCTAPGISRKTCPLTH